jgi:two-component system sensor histidine kinase BaeS
MLLDSDERLIYGREELLPGTSRYPLQLNGETIGSLALLPGPTLGDAAQHRFRQRQGGLLWVIALGIIVLAALLAFPAAAALTRPVRALQQTARRLACGDYEARAPAATQDELGRLAQDLNALAETLGRNEQARRRWVADIAHELRTPLALLQAEIEAMQDGIRHADPPGLSALLDDLLRLRRLVDDLNELTLTEPGVLAYQRQRVDLDSLLEDVVEGFRSRCADKDLDLRLQVEGAGPWQLEGDPDRLAQLLRNLLENSCRYTDPGHSVHVGLERAGPALMITVDDGPPAVDDHALPHLFDRLYRADASRSRGTGGAGLGLAIARNIVEAHAGSIRAVLSQLGGLRVRISLPALDAGDSMRGSA